MKPYEDYFKDIPPSTATIYWLAWDGYEECRKFETYSEAVKFAKKGSSPTKVTSYNSEIEALRVEAAVSAKEKFFDDLHKEFPVLPKDKLRTMFHFLQGVPGNTLELLEDTIDMLISIGLLEAPEGY